ncbi:NtaA/DmoA family FMN-dependent monooxygenase [Lichenifustis flavocetrariae]|uniref:NtaA/DmoA family FMN-dependent monooxygenase n=1 Tax=Lichenifustis flavocetrariae TaxID=2949735 RepID=A0AA42CJK5_9HYPH|nr:NtaA/DmoA family FMN-dependent monooxygenase [Lichenifustis flavocetrariae]MCW6509663.1 NtaA/DmoA family FMN-dependent monooxygenase [Lichenifustis flavocetrariae]
MSLFSRDPAIKVLSFNLLDMQTVGHNNYGLWRHPRNRKRSNNLKYWTDFAQSCERALLDTLFFADVLGIAAGYGGNNDVALREGMHVPLNDPLMALSAMAAVTTHLGFAATVSTTYEAPFAHARRMSTLDHLTGGRIGWNVVTSYLPNANENFGIAPDLYTHDERYDRAEEFMAVCYKLWEGSWADDAMIRDSDRNMVSDPAKVRRIDHAGRYFQVAGPHLVEPSPQRTPVILQAGSSGRGKDFAAKHAEVVFIGGRSADAYRKNARDVRASVVSHGRAAGDVKILAEMGLIVAATQAEAEAKLADFQALSSPDGYLSHHFGSGADLLKYDRNKTIEEITAEGGPGSVFLSHYNYPLGTTVGAVLDQATRLDSSRALFAWGTPKRVADKIEEWADTLDINGFLMRQMISPVSVDEFADLLVPELQRRGRYRQRYEATSLRENMFGTPTPRVRSTHPAAAFKYPLSR